MISSNDVHYGPLCPGESRLNLLGDITGKKVLDIGCGAGQNAVALAKAGAVVSAVDFSEHQIGHARELASNKNVNIDFRVGDIRKLDAFPNSNFDLVLSACAISFVKEIDLVFGEAFRVLKRDGALILSDMHPLQYILDEIKGGTRFNHAYPFALILMKWRWEFGPTSETAMQSIFPSSITCVPWRNIIMFWWTAVLQWRELSSRKRLCVLPIKVFLMRFGTNIAILPRTCP